MLRTQVIVTILWILCLLAGFALLHYHYLGDQTAKKVILSPLSPKHIPVTTTATIPITKITKTLVVPYWTLGKEKIDTSVYDRLIYFGISVNKEGIDANDVGYKNLDQFRSLIPKDTTTLLAVRMITTDINSLILADTKLQKTIIQQSIAIAKEKGFAGIVLDFEISALGFDSVVQSISEFEKQFGDTAKAAKQLFYTTMYGDTFVRLRPFDVDTIAKHADGIMIMAYDFHKAKGNPGPNFPLHDNDKEGYDFTVMTSDFLKHVPAQKITIIFGLFGYDWVVDSKNNATMQATALSYNKIKQDFLDKCTFTECKTRRDDQAAETEITYKDNDNNTHSVWFEDMGSVDKKMQFLSTKNIASVAYWAYSYF